MALRKPLVINSGRVQQLQAGDTLDAIQGGGDAVILTNANAGAVVIGAPVYMSAADSFDKAKADAAGTIRAVGLVATSPSIGIAGSGQIMVEGVLVATTAQWDAVTGDAGGLTFNSIYYVDPATAGKLTKTAPSTVGQYLKEMGIALSTTEMMILPKAEILL